MKAYDLYCGLGGWAEGLLAEGWEVTGFDIEAHDYGTGGYPGKLVIRNVLEIHGAELADADLIVGSSPCQEFSYRAMPWKRAKALPPPCLGMVLFNAQFRIQREASEEKGRHIPMVVENVRGAQKWVGRAQWNFGSYYLWGDVPALMPRASKAQKFNPDGAEHGQGSWFAIADSKNRGSKNTGGSWFNVAHNTTSGVGRNPVHELTGVKVASEKGSRTDVGNGARFTTRDCGIERLHMPMGVRLSEPGGESGAAEQRVPDSQLESVPPSEMSRPAAASVNGVKQGGDWWNKECRKTAMARFGSKSNARKAASAMIAKIPLPLSLHIARTFKAATEEMQA